MVTKRNDNWDAPLAPPPGPAFPYQGVATIVKCGDFFLWAERNIKEGDYGRLTWPPAKRGPAPLDISIR